MLPSWLPGARCSTESFILAAGPVGSAPGRYAAHWTGDNAATWNDLYWSIAGIINTNFWGMPLAGKCTVAEAVLWEWGHGLFLAVKKSTLTTLSRTYVTRKQGRMQYFQCTHIRYTQENCICKSASVCRLIEGVTRIMLVGHSAARALHRHFTIHGCSRWRHKNQTSCMHICAAATSNCSQLLSLHCSAASRTCTS